MSTKQVVAAQFLTSLTTSRLGIFLIVIIFLLIVGGFVEEAASIIILVPVLHPLATRFGINELHWAVILCMTLMIGIRYSAGRQLPLHLDCDRQDDPQRQFSQRMGLRGDLWWG